MMSLSNTQVLANTLGRRGMNRGRSLAEYDMELGLDIVEMAFQSVESNGKFIWYDLCCGYFLAKDEFLNQVHSIDEKVKVVGVDLDIRQEGVIYANAATLPIPSNVNLVTCLQGVDYIQTYLRKGAEAVQMWYNCIGEGAVLSFDVAKNHIQVQGEDISSYLKKVLGDDVETFPTPNRENTHNSVKIMCRERNIQIPIKRGLY